MTSDVALWNHLHAELLPVFAKYRSRIASLPVEVKADRTLLTEADVVVQNLIINAIRDIEPAAVIIAEEDERTSRRDDVLASNGRVWVIDPIDGTAEFVQGGHIEFCSVVCVLEDWQPKSAFILAPELGIGHTPLWIAVDSAARKIVVNGALINTSTRDNSRWLSMTRSKDSPVPAVENHATAAGYRVKTRTTSQTVDMIRVSIDIRALTEPALPPFDLFWRREQKLWDGVAGVCLSRAVGLRECDERGTRLPLGPNLLSAPTPTFPSTVVGRPDTVDWFLRMHT